MADHYEDLPFEEIRRNDGDYFNTADEARALGYSDDQISSKSSL